MVVKKILYHPKFLSDLQQLPPGTLERVEKVEALFKSNPLHPSVRLHPLKGKLKGLWSISVTVGIRIIFERLEGGEIMFISVGKHDIYRAR